MPQVEFRYLTGIRGARFERARLRGSWDADGVWSDAWTEVPMQVFSAEDGCLGFRRTIEFHASQVGRVMRWGVVFDAPDAPNAWAIATEVNDARSDDRSLAFLLTDDELSRQDYHLTWARRLGARKLHLANAPPVVRFCVWAPNARKVEVVFAKVASPYVFDSGEGIDPGAPVLSAVKGDEDIWQVEVDAPFAEFENRPYMYRITNEQGEVRYRTDIFSRRQAGHGKIRPDQEPWDGRIASLDGSKSCSVVVAHDDVASALQDTDRRVTREEFWRDEFDPGHPVPTRLQDMIIYELHVGGLGPSKDGTGTFRDAIAFVEHLVRLGVNCVELMPVNEFSGDAGWGYGQTHHFAFESSAGSLDDYRHFVRACHRQGIAVIQDVCYNHYDLDAERAQWQYDSTLPEHNCYFWYEGRSVEHPTPDGGFLDNGSSGFTPRYHETAVRQQFIASAALMLDECHLDGFRVDLTQAFHRDNTLHRNGLSIAAANLFGQKLLREWTRTLRLLKPSVLLIAEDHTGWEAVTRSSNAGGLGFSARWDVSFYHHLIGDAEASAGSDRILRSAGYGGDAPLSMFGFANALYNSQFNRVVYHESHDEAGNAGGSERTLRTAVGGAPLVGETRRFAEARARTVLSLSMFSAGTPLFFMGEEVGVTQPYTFDGFLGQRDDIIALRDGSGAALFAYYRDAIALRKRVAALRVRDVDVVHVNPEGRVLAFVRRAGLDQVLVVACLANRPYDDGYVIQTAESRLNDGLWHEVLNSDGERYGGANLGNYGAELSALGGHFEARLPACGVVVFRKVA